MPYTDQFERADPLTFNPIGIFDLWPRQAVWEARSLLADGRSTEDVKAIASSVEEMIRNELGRLLRRPIRLPEISVSGNPKAWLWPAEWGSDGKRELRERHGDSNLYQAAITPGQARLPTPIHFEDWEGYAVIALWKLVEFVDALRAPRRRLEQMADEGEQVPRTALGGVLVPEADLLRAQRQAAPKLVEAVRACTLGAECRLRASQMAALETRAQRDRAAVIERAEMQRRQEITDRAREAANKSHEHLAFHQEKAWEMANSKPFRSRIDAARYAAENIAKSDRPENEGGNEANDTSEEGAAMGKVGAVAATPEPVLEWYTERTVDRWLRERGWTPPPDAFAKPKRKR